jgi:Cu/Ag efflux protein CusF
MNSCTRTGKAVAVAAVLLGTAAFSGYAVADQSSEQSAPEENPQALAATLVHVPATVEKIDKSNSEVKLKGPEGRTVAVKASPSVDLNKLKVGDKAMASYYDEIAVSLNKAPTGAPRTTTKTVQRAGVSATQTTVVASVVKVDPPADTIVVRPPMGGEHSLKVKDPDMQAKLKEAKPGDHIEVVYTQAVALTIEPRKT